MRDFPPVIRAYVDSDAKAPDTRSPGRFLVWMVRQQGTLFWFGVGVATIWMIPMMLTPWLMGRAIDDGIVAGNPAAARVWIVALFVVALFGAMSGVLFHTTIVREWLIALYGTVRLVTGKTVTLGHVQSRRTPTGEVLSVAGSDSDTFGAFIEILTRVLSQLLAFIGVALIVMNLSVRLGLVVLLSAPLLVAFGAPMIAPMSRWQEKERSRESGLTSQATDIVAGLRILRGIGGEQTFGHNYAAQSRRVRQAGIAAGVWQAAIDALGVAISGGFVVVLMYLGVQEVAQDRLSIGALISLLGYALFILTPIRTFVEFAQKWTRALVSARKTINVLSQPSPWSASKARSGLDVSGVLRDKVSGFVADPGRLTMVVSADPDAAAALADRLGCYLPRDDAGVVSDEIPEDLKGRAARAELARRSAQRAERACSEADRASGDWGVTIAGMDLANFDIDTIRHHILVSDASPFVFAGTFRDAIDPHRRLGRSAVEEVLHVAAGQDVVEALPDGWEGRLDEKGRGLSGGQRQRVALARALAADADILVMVEPTSAVDAHTEAAIAERLPKFRRGRTTVVTTTSPLLLHHTDVVVLLEGGREVARGTHAGLIATEPRYVAVVNRAREEEGWSAQDSKMSTLFPTS